MRINKHWDLDGGRYPSETASWWSDYATQEEYDSVAIIHYPNDEWFRPIVLDKDYVRSDTHHNIKTFYRGICYLLSIDLKEVKLHRNHREYKKNFGDFYCRLERFEDRDNYFKRWGCRVFTDRRLRTIKKAMEEYYTKEQLGN